ncbi:MAG: ABC transporter permease [Myxococcales bacterium]|nr:ABC transporter permease [Myxococcales bacterium]
MIPVQYNIRSLMVRKVTTAATAGGIALVVFVFAAALMLGEGINRAFGSSGRQDVAVVLRNGSDSELSSGINNDLVNLLKGQPGVSPDRAGEGGVPAVPGVIGEVVVVVSAEIDDGSGGTTNVLIRGMPAGGMAFRPEAKIVSGRAPAPGSNEVVVGKSITGRFKGISPGQSFDLRRNRPLQVVGVFEANGSAYESEVWGDLDVIRTSLGRSAGVSSVRVRLASNGQFSAFKSAVEADKQLGMKATRESDYFRKQSEQTSGFLVGLGIGVAILFSLAAMIGAAITMNGAVANRSKEIGTLRALGFSRLSILISFVLEAIALALIGGVIGTALVMLLASVEVSVLNFQTFSQVVLSFRPTAAVVVTALVFSGVMGLVGGLFPAIRASRVSPVEAMRA